MKRLGVALALLLLPACGLPLPEGVRSAGEVQPARDEPGSLRVIPPGPQPGASPEDIVRGFLIAQSSPADDHAVARQFLAPDTEWDDEQGAVVYALRQFVRADQDPLTFQVRFTTTARIQPTGAFTLDDEPVPAEYKVGRLPSGEFRLSSVPNGLHLTDAARQRSFRPYDVFFLARGADGTATGRLVPDRVFLPLTAARGPALVEALLRGPTLPLRAAVDTAVPPMIRASSVTVADGVVTVDLPREVMALDARQRQRLSAQLVWTLVPTFTGVRLLADGAPLDVDGAREVQTLDDWQEFDPAGVRPDAPLYYVQGRKLRSLDGTLPRSGATVAGPLAVDQVAISPNGGTLGLLTRNPGAAPDEVRVGPPGGPFPVVLRRPELGSLTWGSGEQGLWVVEGGSAPALCLLPLPGAPPRADPCDVPYERPATADPLTALRVSRDGARAAMVFGSGPARRLYVGRIVPAAGRLRIALGPDPRTIAPSLANVTDVAWESGTSLAVLATARGRATQVVVWRVPIDGSTAPVAVQRQGLQGDALAVAAAPGRTLVVSAEKDDVPQLYRDSGGLFLEAAPGTGPTYPG